MQFIINIIRLLRVFALLISNGTATDVIRLYLYQYSCKSSSRKHKAILKLGQNLVLVLPKLGPAFIKLGQVLSTRADLIGVALCSELTKVQDRLPAFSFTEVKKEIESQLETNIQNIFKYVEETPYAVASIAQVHKAETIDGEKVAIKILKPTIEKQFASNLKVLYFIARFIDAHIESIKRLKLIDIVDKISELISMELDLRLEAAAADKLRINCVNDVGIYIPKILWQYTKQRILVLEWVDGISINNKIDLVNAGFDLHELAAKLAIIFFNQAFRDGFFHADMHQGNIFVNKYGDIVLVDFGIVGYLDIYTKSFIAEILYGFAHKDYKKVADVHFKAGYVPDSQSVELFELACRSIGEPIVGKPIEQISISLLLKQLFETTRKFKMETQPQLLLLQKTMMTVEGVGYFLYPEVNMWALIIPWIQDWSQKNLGVTERLIRMKQDVKQLPINFNSLISNLNTYLKVKIADNASEALDNDKKHRHYKGSSRIIMIILIFALGIVCGIVIK